MTNESIFNHFFDELLNLYQKKEILEKIINENNDLYDFNIDLIRKKIIKLNEQINSIPIVSKFAFIDEFEFINEFNKNKKTIKFLKPKL